MTARIRIRKDPDSPPWDGEHLPWQLDFMEPKDPDRKYDNLTGLDTHDRHWTGGLAFATFAEAVNHLVWERVWCLDRIRDNGDHWYSILADLYGTDEPTMRTALTPTTNTTQNDGARRSEDTD